MSSTISTGTSVTPSSAAKNIAKVLVKASGLKSRPSCAVSEKTGMKLTVMTSSEKKSGRPTLFAAAMMTRVRSRVVRLAPVLVAEMLQRLVRVLDHDDRRIDHRADGDGDAAERHDVRGKPEPEHRQEREDDRDRQRDDRDQRRADVPEENDADQRDDDALLDQLFAQRVRWRS